MRFSRNLRSYSINLQYSIAKFVPCRWTDLLYHPRSGKRNFLFIILFYCRRILRVLTRWLIYQRNFHFRHYCSATTFLDRHTPSIERSNLIRSPATCRVNAISRPQANIRTYFEMSQYLNDLSAKSFRRPRQTSDPSIEEQLARGLSQPMAPRGNFSIRAVVTGLKLLVTRIPRFPLEKARGHAAHDCAN